jgi:beta-glucanase (GH16 family)
MFAIILLIIFSFSSVSAEITKPPVEGNWTLTLNENFDSFNNTIWNTKLETPKLTYRRSSCFFLDDNVYTQNGNLLFVTKFEKLKLTDLDGETKKLKYSSGLVNSFTKFKQKYGYFEARIKLPVGRGLWSAFWLMPDRLLDVNNVSFQKGMRSTKIVERSEIFINGKGMEIDIMEYLTEWKRKKYHIAAHWDGYSESLKSHRGFYKPEKEFDDGYHKFGLYWAKDLLVWYFDGIEINRFESPRVADVPMYMILSTNLGGWATWRVERDHLPEQTVIDYVRVWQSN